jgi:hypothetical protein
MSAWSRRLSPAGLLALLPALLSAQISPAWSGCRGDTLSTWNCAQYYSGTVTLTNELKGPNLHETYSAVATITAGKVVCHIKGSEAGEWRGAGMVAVQHDNTGNGGDYEIMVWCPDSDGERPSRHSAPLLHVQHQRVRDYAVLEGKEEYEHPNADEANGLAGTESLAWQLRRN